MNKTIQEIEEMAKLYIEEEIFEFEQMILKSNEVRSEESKTISQLTGYELYINHMDENGFVDDYSYLCEEIRLFIARYDKCSIEEVDTNSTYYQMLAPRIAQGKLKAISEMYHLYFGRVYNYKVLNADIDSFIILHGLSKYNNYQTLAKKRNTIILVQAIELYNKGRSSNKQRTVNDLVNSKDFYDSLKLISMSKDGNNYPKPSTLSNYHSEYKRSNK